MTTDKHPTHAAADEDAATATPAASKRGGTRARMRALLGLLAVALVALGYLATDPGARFRPAQDGRLEEIAQSYASGLRNRLRVADHALRALGNDLASRGLDTGVDGSATRHYFQSLGLVEADGNRVALHGPLAAVPELTRLMREEIHRGDTAIAAGTGDAAGDVYLLRNVHAGTTSAMLIAQLSPRYLWRGMEGGANERAACVLQDTGAPLHCVDPARIAPARALRLESLTASAGTTRLEADGRSWGVGYARFDLPTSNFGGTWTVTQIDAGESPSTAAVLSVLGPPLLGGAAIALAVLWLTRRGRSRGERSPSSAEPVAAATPSALPPPAARDGKDRQRNAIRAMADLDRCILSETGPRHLVEHAVRTLPTFVDCDVVTIVAREDEIAVRLASTTRRAGDDGALQSTECPADDSFDALLRSPPDGIWIHDPAAHRCLEAQVRLGVSSTLVIPIYADSAPTALVCLGLIDRNYFAPEALSYARALADRIGVALTAAARKARVYAHANFDPVTQLPNRQYLLEHLPQQIARTKREGKRLAVLFVDLDDFRDVNLVAGHNAGDNILQLAASRLRERLREEDLLVRFGSDEFVIVLPHIHRSVDAVRVAEASIGALKAPFVLNDHEHRIGACIGISVFPDDAQCLESLLRHADAAMFRAKESGKAQYAFFDADADRHASERSAIERELRAALGNGEAYLVYQPQIDLATGAIDGAEALIRWRHPRRGMVSPAQFIAVAEQSQLIVDVGDFVLRSVCRQYARWAEQGVAPPRVSVNLTNTELRRADFVDKVDQVLRDSGMRPHCLEFEITERLVVTDSPETLAKLAALQARGVRIAIDDFGTGYSSLSYLKRLPCDVVKIDQSFVGDLGRDSDSESIVRAVIGMAHSLGRKVIAEGVETEEARDYLARHGCGYGQGYLWSRPLPAEEYAAFVASMRGTAGRLAAA